MNRLKLSFIASYLIVSCNFTDSTDTQNKKNQNPKETQTEFIPVKTVKIKPEIFNNELVSNGIIEAHNKTELRFKTSERISSIKVTNGQKVKKGQVLAILDNVIIKNQLDKAKIAFDKAKSKFQEEKINYGLDNLEDNNIESNVLKNLKIKSNYFEAENEFQYANLLYNQTFLKSPFNGVVANVKLKRGDFITSGDIFCSIIEQEKLDIVFSILENEMSFIKKNQDISITPFANKNKSYTGIISEINPIVDENGLIQIKAKINNTNNSLFDGMHAMVSVSEEVKGIVVIPKEALVIRSNRKVVFTIENNLAKWNYVKVSYENSSQYGVEEGLNVGDSIIVSGNINLSHDSKVIMTPEDQ